MENSMQLFKSFGDGEKASIYFAFIFTSLVLQLYIFGGPIQIIKYDSMKYKSYIEI